MYSNVPVQKTVYSKDQLDKVIDRSFKTYLQPEDLPKETTVEEFFADYERLYYDIPVYGENQSHEYLINRSSLLVSFEKDTQDIQPLLDEITTLRQQIIEYQQQLLELTQKQLK